MLQSTSSQHSHQSSQQQHNIINDNDNNIDANAKRQLVRLGSELQESLTAFFNRILSKNKFLFNIRRLQGLIVHNSWSNGFGTEYENLRDVITNITRKYHNSSGIWGLHGANTRFAHIHWLHMCTSYSNGDCKCRITEYLRNNGYTIHWDKRYSQEGLARRLAQSTVYLFQRERQFICVRIAGRRQDFGGELLARIKVYREMRRSQSSNLALEADCVERWTNHQEGIRNPRSPIDDDATTGGIQAGHSWKICPQKVNELSKKIQTIIGTHFPQNVTELYTIEEFIEITKDIIVPYSSQLNNYTKQTWDCFIIDWNKKSFKSIIDIRQQSIWPSNKYYSIELSQKIMQALLIEQYGSCEEAKHFIKRCKVIVTKRLPKKNSLAIIGPPGSGKTYFLKSLTNLVWNVGYIESNINKNSNFPFENLYNRYLGVINEFNCSESQRENCKEVFEGNGVCIAVKYKNRTCIPRIPIFVTSNNNFLDDMGAIDREAFQHRMYVEYWQQQPWLKELMLQLHPLVWQRLENEQIWNEPTTSIDDVLDLVDAISDIDDDDDV